MDLKISEIIKKQHENYGVGQMLSHKGKIIDTTKLCLGEDVEDDETTSTWLVTPEGNKIRRITREEFELIKKFALTGR